MLNRLRRRYKKWPVDVVLDDGSDAPLDQAGVCARCSRPLDEHNYWLNGQWSMTPYCPLSGEWVSGFPKGGDKPDLGWLEWLMKGLEDA